MAGAGVWWDPQNSIGMWVRLPDITPAGQFRDE